MKIIRCVMYNSELRDWYFVTFEQNSDMTFCGKSRMDLVSGKYNTNGYELISYEEFIILRGLE